MEDTDPTNTITYCSTYIKSGSDKLYFIEESAIIELLAANVLFMCGGYGSKSDTIELAVNCNDLFWWGTADAEQCLPNELEDLYKAWKADPRWGPDIWCCHHRKLQPQVPIVKKMKSDGVWTNELEALSDPGPS